MLRVILCLLLLYLSGCATSNEEIYYEDDKSIQIDLDLLMF